MRRLILILSIVILLPGTLLPQATGHSEGSILIHGVIADAGTGKPLSGSQIFVNETFASVSDTEGKFAFYINRNDTLQIRSLGYKPAMIGISDTLRGKEFIAGIFMFTDTLEIPAVVIMPRLATLKSDILRPQVSTSQEITNARYNLAVSAYQGRVNQGRLGDPSMNYELIRQQQKNDAYSKGQIPSDRMVGLSPFMVIPAIYLLMNGLPEKPVMVTPVISENEADMIYRKYLESMSKK
jgi:hypothetical protein